MRAQAIYLALAIILLCPFVSAQWIQTRTVVQLPDSVALVEPANNVTLFTSGVRFVWRSGQAGVVRYWFELTTDSSFASSVADTAIVDTTKGWIQLSNGRYWWRAKACNLAGWGPFSEIWTFGISACGVGNLSSNPKEFSLAQSFPNPFNPSTTIKFELPRTSNVNLSVYDMLGREVSVLVSEKRNAGVHEVHFNAGGLSSGVYFYRIQAGSFVQTRKLLLIR